MTDDLVTRLRQLSRAEHDDLDICDEAADEIINLRVDVHVLREMLEKYKRDAIEAALQSQATEAYPCRIVETDFETSTVTLEMQGKYTVSSGQKYLCDVPLYKCPDFSCQGLLDSSNHIADMCKKVKENHIPDASKMVTPDGWQLVPIEPTEEMRANLLGWHLGLNLHDAAGDKYKAMLAAAPKYKWSKE